jgi:hypothetical protein
MSRAFVALFRSLFGHGHAKSPLPVEAEKARSVADLLEFGYSVSSADRRFPHMPA